DVNGNLAKQIFTSLYSGYYGQAVFLGIDTGVLINPMQSNQYFNIPAGDNANSLLTKAEDAGNPNVAGLSISLENNKLIRLILWH
ncbi:MAG TPA: hypothetical protein VMC07_02110, partial [Candidatus Omnitrophota bacterium]|nr:hypothetical protein [Candidatus Omnitrophota bacterium]